MAPFTDTHVHFDFHAFDPDREALLAECARRRITRLVVPGVNRTQVLNLPSWRRIGSGSGVTLALAAGLHPYYLATHTPAADVPALARALASGAYAAVGEMGLHAPAGNLVGQVALLEDQLALARAAGLPVILHQVGAHNEMVRALQRVPPPAGVVHAFTGSSGMAREYLRLGLSLGVGGAITYPRARKTRAAIRTVDATRLVLETDAPDMPLCGFQGVRNSPLQIPQVFRQLCALRGAGSEAALALADQLEANATALFFPTA